MNPIRKFLEDQKIEYAAAATRWGVTRGMVGHWATGRKRVSLERCVVIENDTRGALTCEVMRPDVNWSAIRGDRTKLSGSEAATSEAA